MDSDPLRDRRTPFRCHPPARRAARCHLDDIARIDQERAVIHGDFTNDNVIASGTQPAATGLIDFALAHVEHPLADIGYALWRSCRPAEHATTLDLDRLRHYAHGYHLVRPLSADHAAWGCVGGQLTHCTRQPGSHERRCRAE